jgi:hypothetical protein
VSGLRRLASADQPDLRAMRGSHAAVHVVARSANRFCANADRRKGSAQVTDDAVALSTVAAARYLTSRGFATTARQLMRWRVERIGPAFLAPPHMRPCYLRADLDAFIAMLASFRVRTVTDRNRPTIRAIVAAPKRRE